MWLEAASGRSAISEQPRLWTRPINCLNNESFVESRRGGPPRAPSAESAAISIRPRNGGRMDTPRIERRAFLAAAWSLGLGALALAAPGRAEGPATTPPGIRVGPFRRIGGDGVKYIQGRARRSLGPRGGGE